jgi:PTS system mannitol-specific IIC component
MAQSIPASEVTTIVLACEAGMGSSLMSVNALKKRLKNAQMGHVKVLHKPARGIPQDAQVILVHKGLAKVAQSKAPQAVVLAFNHFFNDPVFDQLVQALTNGSDIVSNVG